MDEPTRSDSPYQEPDNSTVDDWHGQKLARQEEEADRLVGEADGNVDEARARFDREPDEASS